MWKGWKSHPQLVTRGVLEQRERQDRWGPAAPPAPWASGGAGELADSCYRPLERWCSAAAAPWNHPGSLKKYWCPGPTPRSSGPGYSLVLGISFQRLPGIRTGITALGGWPVRFKPCVVNQSKGWDLGALPFLWLHLVIVRMPVSLLENHVPFVIISVELNVGGVDYQHNSTLSVQKLSLLFLNKPFLFLFFYFFGLCGYLDVFGCIFGSRTLMSGFLRK